MGHESDRSRFLTNIIVKSTSILSFLFTYLCIFVLFLGKGRALESITSEGENTTKSQVESKRRKIAWLNRFYPPTSIDYENIKRIYVKMKNQKLFPRFSEFSIRGKWMNVVKWIEKIRIFQCIVYIKYVMKLPNMDQMVKYFVLFVVRLHFAFEFFMFITYSLNFCKLFYLHASFRFFFFLI